MSKELTYRQRMARIVSVGVVAFAFMWIGIAGAKFGGVEDYNTQQVITFFIVSCGAVWLFAILSAIVIWLENWLLEKIEQRKE